MSIKFIKSGARTTETISFKGSGQHMIVSPSFRNLAGGLARPIKVALDSTHVYWTNQGTDSINPDTGSGTFSANDGSVMRMPLGGGDIETLASGQGRPYDILVKDGIVYWTNRGGGQIRRMPVGGGTIVTMASGIGSPAAIATNSTHVYYSTIQGNVGRVPLNADGATPETRAAGITNTTGLEVTDTHVYWCGVGASPFTAGIVRSISTSDFTTGTPLSIASGVNYPLDLCLTPTRVVWTSSNAGQVQSAPLGSAYSGDALITGRVPAWIASSGERVFFSANGGPPNSAGSINSINVDGSNSIFHRGTQAWPQGIAVNGTHIYWVERGYYNDTGRLNRISRV